MAMKSCDLLVVGSGILGLAHTLSALRAGVRVTLAETHATCVDASVRNFGYLTSLVCGEGVWGDRARRTRDMYAHMAREGHITFARVPGLQLAQTQAQMAVLEEYAAGVRSGDVTLLRGHEEVLRVNPGLAHARDGGVIVGGLVFRQEGLLEPRVLGQQLRDMIARKWPHTFTYLPHTHVTSISSVPVTAASAAAWRGCASSVVANTAQGRIHAGAAVLCTGHHVNTLLPGVFHAERQRLKLVKLHMMRLRVPVPLPMSTTSGLSLLRYPVFNHCASLAAARAEEHHPHAKALDIHIIARPAFHVERNEWGSLLPGAHTARHSTTTHEVVLGDSHQYAGIDAAHELDDAVDAGVEEAMLTVARTMLPLPATPTILSRWPGYYLQHADGVLNARYVVTSNGQPEVDAHGSISVVTGIGGKGMTTALALAEENVSSWYGVTLKDFV